MNGCQGTPWSEELDDRELHGAAWWRVRSEAEKIRFFLHTPAGVSTTLPTIYKCGITLVLNGVVFLHDPLYCCSKVLEYPTYSFVSSSRTVFLSHGRNEWHSKEICIS